MADPGLRRWRARFVVVLAVVLSVGMVAAAWGAWYWISGVVALPAATNSTIKFCLFSSALAGLALALILGIWLIPRVSQPPGRAGAGPEQHEPPIESSDKSHRILAELRQRLEELKQTTDRETTLKKLDALLNEATEGESQPQQPTAVSLQNGPARILVVDDEKAIRRVLQIALKRYGYQVATAASGPEVLAQLRERRFDLLLADVVMPEMNGIELVERVSRIHPDIVVVMVTGFASVEMAKGALKVGASDFITKPVNVIELPIVIERNLERRRLETLKLMEQGAQILFEAIKALAAAIDAKDKYTAGHSRRVAELSAKLANALELSGDQKYLLELAAQMHDIGKIGTPDYLMYKTSDLTDREWQLIKRHPEDGAQIVNQIEELAGMASIIRHHHERVDGAGYPDGLKEEAIPLLSRIITIADAYEAMTSGRAYRSALTPEQAIQEIEACSGTQFDPQMAKVFLSTLRGGTAQPALPAADS